MGRIQRSLRFGAAMIAIRLAAGSPDQMESPLTPDASPSARRLVATVLATLAQ